MDIPQTIKHMSIPYKERLIQAYKVLKMNIEDGDWFRDSAKRAVTRAFYQQVADFRIGYISSAAFYGGKISFDHCFIPQAYCYYIMAYWDTIGQSLETFFPHWVIASTGIDVTPKENRKLSTFTLNNSSTGNLLKVKVALIDRYKKAGITIINPKNAREEVVFSMVAERLDESYGEWEKNNLIF